MRFNNRACALMDIPDLPQSAFEHIGDRKIKPQGGGGGGIPIVSDVVNVVSDIGESFDKAITQPVGKALSEADTTINREVPGGWIAPATVATVIAAPYLAPVLAESGLAAESAALLDAAALAEGGTTAGMVATANTGIPAGTSLLIGGEAVGQALPYTVAADAANLAANGFDAATIAQNLTATGVDSFVAADAANLAAQGLSESAIAQNLAQGYTAAELGGTGLTSTLPTASKGISIGQALQGARLASGLLSSGQQQQPSIPTMTGSRMQMPQGAVDYSGLYNLLALQRQQNPNSLLG